MFVIGFLGIIDPRRFVIATLVVVFVAAAVAAVAAAVATAVAAVNSS